jgi:hypothetical protein
VGRKRWAQPNDRLGSIDCQNSRYATADIQHREVPKGRLKVAQDVVLGNHYEAVLVPQGTAEILHARIHPPLPFVIATAGVTGLHPTEGDENTSTRSLVRS